MSKPIIAVAFYSTWGHIGRLAEQVIAGVESTGAIVKPYVFKETLPEEVLTKMHAGSSLEPKYPILTPNDLKDVDGLIMGCPTRYGRVPSQVSAFFDQCGQLWATGALVGKFVTMFTAAAGQHGGHETTALTTMPFFIHMGMAYVPIGYQDAELQALSTVQGGAPYGASTVTAGDGHLQPTEDDLNVAKSQGKYFATFVATFVRGKQSSESESAAAAKLLAPPIAAQQKQEGYTVPQTPEKTTETTAAKPSPAPAAPVAATAQGPTPARPAPTQSKKKPWYASCCGGAGIDE